jgi:serine/threonine protein kinase
MWALGIIACELLTGGKVQMRGRDYIHQILLAVELIGVPQESSCEFMSPEGKRVALSANGPATLSESLCSLPSDAQHLVRHLLQFHPAERFTARDVLSHPFLARFKSPEDEAVSEEKLTFMTVEGANEDQLRRVLWEMLSTPPAADEDDASLRNVYMALDST